MPESRIIHGDCLGVLPSLADASVDCVVSDPPYAEVDRSYGRLTESQWHSLMDGVVNETRRILKPKGSAVFVLQPNSRHVGEMRLWLWEWMLRTAKAWNLVQDAYWWNHTALPTSASNGKNGLMRPSVKMCCWFGPADCYRDQSSALWEASKCLMGKNLEDRALQRRPSGCGVRDGRTKETAIRRGGTTPFNLLPLANSNSVNASASHGHGAGTPRKLCEWWVKYLCPPGGVVLDPFNGAGTVGVAAVSLGRSYVGIEQHAEYCAISRERIAAATPTPDLFTRKEPS